MSVLATYRLRLRRKRLRLRALRQGRALRPCTSAGVIAPGEILLFATLRNEGLRLPFFLNYYRELGVNRFLIVDNGSDDGSADYLANQPDVMLWQTGHSYRNARFGMDWMNALLARYGHGHWCLTVDPDEFLVYPFCDSRPLRALTDWLDASAIRSFGTMLLDMYPKGPIGAQPCRAGQNPIEIAPWFDPGNYTVQRNRDLGNLWIQGGPRARAFFADRPAAAPALNKIPLVHWDRRFVYTSSTHSLLPRGLNLVYDEWGGEKACGLLLHSKFIGSFADKAHEEMTRAQHYAGSREYRAYAETGKTPPDLWCRWSERYVNWRQVEILGLMSRGNWA